MVLFLLIAVALAFFEIPLVHKPFVIGHRGTSTEVENTVESITAGAAQGNDFGELDVQLTKDEVPVVFHDETLRRLTGRDGRVSGDLTLAEIKELALYENGKDRENTDASGHLKRLKQRRHRQDFLSNLCRFTE